MPWAKLDDQFHSSPKLQRAKKDGNAVAGVFSRSLSYCAAGLSDGFVDGYWAASIAPPRLLALLTLVGLWKPVQRGDTYVVEGRRDSGRRKLADVTVVMPEDGYFIPDFLHMNPSRDEVRKSRTDARSDVHQNGEQSQPSPSQPVFRAVTDPVEKLLEALTDKDEGTRGVITALIVSSRLSEGDLMYARDCATGPGVRSPTAVAVAALKERAA